VSISLGRKEGKASEEEILALHLSGKGNAAEEAMDTEKNMLVGCSEEDETVSYLMLFHRHSFTHSQCQTCRDCVWSGVSGEVRVRRWWLMWGGVYGRSVVG